MLLSLALGMSSEKKRGHEFFRSFFYDIVISLFAQLHVPLHLFINIVVPIASLIKRSHVLSNVLFRIQ